MTYPGGQTIGARPDTLDNLVYCRPSDIITSQATISTDSSVSSDDNYGLSSLFDQIPARPLKIGLGPCYILFDFGEPQRIDGFALPNSNLSAGDAPATIGTVKLNATNVWTSPTMSVPLIAGPDHLDGHRASPWLDLRDKTGYSTGGFQYLRFDIGATTMNIKIGEILIMSRLREFTRWVHWQGTKGAQRRFLEALETEYGVTRVHRRRIKQRFFSFELQLDNQDWRDLNDLADDAGGLAVPFFIAANSGNEQDEGLYARFTRESAARLEATEEWYDSDVFNLSVLEVSRGLPFGEALVEVACS